MVSNTSVGFFIFIFFTSACSNVKVWNIVNKGDNTLIVSLKTDSSHINIGKSIILFAKVTDEFHSSLYNISKPGNSGIIPDQIASI